VVLFGEYFQLELAKAARSEDVFSVVSDVASAWPDHPEISQFAIDRNKKHDLKATTHCTTLYSISTEFFEAGGRWPVWLFIAARGQKSKQ